MKQQEPMKTVKALVGPNVHQKRALLRRVRHPGRDPARHRHANSLPQRRRVALERGQLAQMRVEAQGPIKILTSCPSCLQGLSRYGQDLQNGLLEADYIVVEMAKHILGPRLDAQPTWQAANHGGIERVLV
jgi:hypothetical protein